jgi:hypothetical protein
MPDVTRRQAMRLMATTGAGALTASALGAAESAQEKKTPNSEAPVASRAKPDTPGPRELFAVVDAEGNLKRGLHAVSSKRLAMGVYEVIFPRDVRRGVYLASPGGHGFEGIPLAAAASVMGRATDPNGVLVYTVDLTGAPLNTGFHLLVVCPEGFA